MRLLFKSLLALCLLSGGGYFAWVKGAEWLKERNRPEFRLATVERGKIRIVRKATGKVKPVLSVQIGSFVSGPINGLFVDFNDEVVEGQLLATVDPKIYQAAVDRDTATLAARVADVKRVEAELQRAINDEKRSLALQAENEDFISQTEMDQFHFSRTALEAQLVISKATIKQAEADLENSTANLEYTEIRSPVDGIVTHKTIEPGQTLAAQFQAPELFEIAPDLRKKMHIFASIDEADMGLIRQAKDAGEPVVFSVEAYPDEIFTDGVIEQIRLKATTTQNVVTYPVVVATPNADMKLLPDMTANLTFQVAVHEDVLKVPNSAVRYLPENKEHVHEDDHDKLDFSLRLGKSSDENAIASLAEKPIDEVKKSDASRHVWVIDGEKLRAVEVQLGVSDLNSWEVTGGKLKSGDKVVVGLKTED